jgi:hypothetical protein
MSVSFKKYIYIFCGLVVATAIWFFCFVSDQDSDDRNMTANETSFLANKSRTGGGERANHGANGRSSSSVYLRSEIKELLLKYGPGDRRTQKLRFLFATSNAPLIDLIETSRDFPLDSECDAALDGVFFRIATKDEAHELQRLLKSGNKLFSKEKMILASGLGCMGTRSLNSYFPQELSGVSSAAISIRPFESSFQLLRELVLASPEDDGELEHAYLGNSVYHYPFESWKIISSMEGGILGEKYDEIKGVSIEKMFISSPSDALLQVIDEDHLVDGVTSDLFVNGISKWINNDINGVVFWYQNGESDLSTDIDNLVVMGFSQVSVSKGEFDLAWDWVEKIEIPEVRKKAEGQVWKAEKRVVDQASRQNPVSLVEAIVSGASIHAEYWIKDVYQEWTTTSPDAAASWYEENRQTLTPEQNQHVARVYAEQAIESGDLDLAKQWAGEVIEEKFTKKLQEKISAAEAVEK